MCVLGNMTVKFLINITVCAIIIGIVVGLGHVTPMFGLLLWAGLSFLDLLFIISENT